MVLKKFTPLQNDIIFIDGLWGTGKSLLSPIVSGMERVEKIKFEHVYEYIGILHYLKRISPDAASWLLTTYADLSQYNNLIGREVNLRWGDDSGLANNPRSLRYVRRLFEGDGDHKVSEINDSNMALNIMTHMLMLAPDPIFETYGDRAKVIEVVRHPLYMVHHWHSYFQRFDSPREFTISFDHNGNKVPWFAAGWEDEFVEAGAMDKVLLCIIKLYEWLDVSINKVSADGCNLLTLSFESLVTTPDEPLRQIESFLGRGHYKRLSSVLRKQKIPRKTISQGRGHSSYGWVKESSNSEADVYAKNMNYIRAGGTDTVVTEFEKLIDTYNKKYPSLLSRYS